MACGVTRQRDRERPFNRRVFERVSALAARPRGGPYHHRNTRVNFIITERPDSCNLPLPVTCELYSSLFILNREHDERSNTCVGTQSECCGVPHIISISFDLVFDDPPAPRAVGAVVGTCMQGSAAPAPRPLVRSQHAIRVHHPSIYCCDHRGQRLDSSNVVNAEHRARFVNKR